MDLPTALHGIAASPGRAVGPVAHIVKSLPPPTVPGEPGDPDEDAARLRSAARHVRRALQERAGRVSGVARSMLEMGALMAEDPSLLGNAEALIREGSHSAEAAIWQAGEDLAAQLRAMGGATAERGADVIDIRNRIAAHLMGAPVPGIPERDEPYVLVADDLAPSDTALLSPGDVVAIVTEQGGPTSHTAILAREIGIPAVVAVSGAMSIPEGEVVAVDGSGGRVRRGEIDVERFLATQPPTFEYEGPGHTSDGVPVALMANVGDGHGARMAARLGADGIGLLRTEFSFPPSPVAPSVEAQAAQYGEVFAAFPGRRVVVRLLDAGADKPMPFLTHGEEPNPALGVRGYRALVLHPEVLDDQLTAIRLAADRHEAEVWVMAPMIATVDETADFVARCRAAGLGTAGVMIEIPSAAVRSAPLLAEADFASIGTNDLTQYALAADRTFGPLAEFADPWEPAVLSLIKIANDGAASQGRPIGVCGEAAADPALAVVLVGLGASSLSMSPHAIPAVAAVLERTSHLDCRRMAEIALAAQGAAEARAAVRDALPVIEELHL